MKFKIGDEVSFTMKDCQLKGRVVHCELGSFGSYKYAVEILNKPSRLVLHDFGGKYELTTRGNGWWMAEERLQLTAKKCVDTEFDIL